MKNILKDKRGESYIDCVVGIFCIVMVVSFAIHLFPVFTAKQSLDTFAIELVREAEIQGRTDIQARVEQLKKETGLNPNIRWEANYYRDKKVQINGDITVMLSTRVNIGFFSFGSIPIELNSKATGKSEVYYK